MLRTLLTTTAIAAAGLLLSAPAIASTAPSGHHPPNRGRSRRAYVTRAGAHLKIHGRDFRFGAANIYWLGLDENVGGIDYPTRFRIDDALKTAKAMGATVVRSHTLGVSTGDPHSLEPTLGEFNDKAFATIDYAIARARHYGLRLIVPLTDNWSWYHGGRHDFTDWLGLPTDAFYTDSRVIAAFERYIDHLLDHVDPLTGVAYKNDPTIMAWELGNELNGMPRSWIDEIARYLKKKSPRHLVAAGRQDGIDPDTLASPKVDIVDVHYYPPKAEQIIADARTVTEAGKVYIAGEYGSVSASSSLLSPVADDPDVTGAAFWSLFAHNDDHGYVQHDDGFTLLYPGDDAAMRRHAEAIRAFSYAMAGARDVPPVPAPGRPLITHLTRSDGDVTVTWRGATTAGAYSVQRARSSNGPWITVCDRCATDDTGPWTDTSAPESRAWYRVTGYTLEGTRGPASPSADISSRV